MGLCTNGDFAHGGVTNAALRIVNNSAQCLFVVGIGHHAEIGQHVFDDLALIETHSAEDAIRNFLLEQFFF